MNVMKEKHLLTNGNRLAAKLQRLALAVCLLTAICACQGADESHVGPSLKVLTWNVWHGGHSEEYPERGCEGTIGMLKASGADVITMVETYGASNRVADSLGYYHRLISNNLSIYSRYPIVETYTYPDSIATFNFGGVMIDVGGRRVRVFDTWLHYLPDATEVPTDSTEQAIIAWECSGTRDEEIRRILSTLRPYLNEADSIPVIMSGDFNTHSHLDWTVATRQLYRHGGAVVRWPVSVAMEQAGFKDSFREIYPDAAQHIGTTWRYAGEEPNRSDRIDYIYYTGKKLKAVASETHNGLLGEPYTFRGREFLYASDHGFVLTEFKWDK